jgi:hypothetical protein
VIEAPAEYAVARIHAEIARGEVAVGRRSGSA